MENLNSGHFHKKDGSYFNLALVFLLMVHAMYIILMPVEDTVFGWLELVISSTAIDFYRRKAVRQKNFTICVRFFLASLDNQRIACQDSYR